MIKCNNSHTSRCLKIIPRDHLNQLYFELIEVRLISRDALVSIGFSISNLLLKVLILNSNLLINFQYFSNNQF